MSLINEALKKAQKQRTQDVASGPPAGTPPSPESAPPRRVVKRSQPMPAQTLVIVGGACLVIVGVVAIGFWLLIGPSPETTSTPSPLVVGSATPASTTSATTPPTPVPSGVVSAGTGSTASVPADPARAATATAATSSAAPGTAAVVTPTPVGGVASLVFNVKMEEKGTETAPAEAAAAGQAGDPADASTATEEGGLHIDVPASEAGFVPPNSRSSAIVDALRISGIRASATDPKVLMNERVYRLNDVVDHTIGLRLKEINSTNLVFIDETGATYVRNF